MNDTFCRRNPMFPAAPSLLTIRLAAEKVAMTHAATEQTPCGQKWKTWRKVRQVLTAQIEHGLCTQDMNTVEFRQGHVCR